MWFDPPRHDVTRRQILLDVLGAALDAVEPAAAVARHLAVDGSRITVAGSTVDVPGKVIVLAIGKAAAAMAGAAITAIERVTGVVVAPDLVEMPGLLTMRGGHPLPDDASLAAGRALLAAAFSAGPDDLVLALVSGGGSALAEVPAPGVTLSDIRTVIGGLLNSGAPIADVNLVRTHLSAIKGGRLAAAAAPARVATLVLSDVPGDDPGVVASGPTIATSSTPPDALTTLAAWGVVVPDAVRSHLADPAVPGAVAAGPVAIIGSGGVAAAAAVRAAQERGLDARVVTTALAGEARSAARTIVRDSAPGVDVYAGETTVTVAGDGRGGRNQELALAAAIELDGRSDVIVATLGTDGIDGPTRAAGAFADGSTLDRGQAAGLDAGAALADNDSHGYLSRTGDLIVTGPTGTNVADLVVVWHRGRRAGTRSEGP